MSATVLDQDYVAPPAARPIKARPLGTLAALMMGVSAVTALGAARLFLAPTPAAEPTPVALKEPQVLSPPRAQATAEGAAEPSAPEPRTAVFELAAPDFANEKKTIQSRDLEGGSREDSLSLGEFGFGGAYLRLDIGQSGSEKLANRDFFLDMTRHARDAGLAAKKIHPPTPLSTRFGRLESADIKLAAADPGNGGLGMERSCLAVRLINPAAAFEISGFACGASAKPIDRVALGCILDQLAYRPSSENRTLEQLFAAQTQHGAACATAAETKKPAAAHAAAHAKVNRKNPR